MHYQICRFYIASESDDRIQLVWDNHPLALPGTPPVAMPPLPTQSDSSSSIELILESEPEAAAAAAPANIESKPIFFLSLIF